jgi:uncharacterized OB-fold protein
MSLESDFKQRLLNGELHVQLCTECGRSIMYPKPRCPYCYSSLLGWRQVQGTGTLLSFTVVRATSPSAFREDIPYAIGIVRLAEGPQLMCRLHPDPAGNFSGYRCDMDVEFAPAPPAEIERRPVAWFKSRSTG